MAIQVLKWAFDSSAAMVQTNRNIEKISDRIISITPFYANKSFLIVIYDDSDPVETPLVNRRIR